MWYSLFRAVITQLQIFCKLAVRALPKGPCAYHNRTQRSRILARSGQGRITKVLNMKPPEILGMIEEAAGTRMFEQKKQSAQKTIEKKQQKVTVLAVCVS